MLGSFPLCLRILLQEKKVGTSNMLPNIMQTKSNDNSLKDPDDQVWLLMQVSFMIEIVRFFYIKSECDTSSKAMLELRRLILRGSLEIHVGDYMMLMGLLLRIS